MRPPELTQEQRARLRDPRYARTFELLTPEPERLLPILPQLRFALDGAESGGPVCDPERPLVVGTPWEAVAEALGTDDPDALIDGWTDLLPLLSLASLHGRIEPGTYQIRNVDMEHLGYWLGGYVDEFVPETFGLDEQGQMRLTEPNISLLRHANWRWVFRDGAVWILEQGVTWPGPMIDSKRVYGDMSYIELDMMQILGLPVLEHNEQGHPIPTRSQQQELSALHQTLLPATQAFVENVTLDLGSVEVRARLAEWSVHASR